MRLSNVLYVSEYPGFGGGEVVLINIIQNLDIKNFKPLLLLVRDNPLLYNYISENHLVDDIISLPLSLWNKKNPLPFFISCFELIKLLKSKKISLVHCNTLELYTPFIIPCRLLNIPLVVHEHNIRPVEKKGIFIKFLFSLINQKCRIIAVSNIVKKQILLHKIPEKNIQVIHNGINLKKFDIKEEVKSKIRDELKISQDEIVIGIFARFERYKRHIDLINAIGILKSYNLIRCLIVGDDSSIAENSKNVLSELKSRIKELEIEDKFIFTGFRSDIPELMQSVDIIVLPSNNDPFPLSILEGMASGKVVIGAASGGIPEAIEDGVSGLLFKTGSPEDLAQKIKWCIDNPQLLKKISENARNRVQKLFSLDLFINRIQELYKELL